MGWMGLPCQIISDLVILKMDTQILHHVLGLLDFEPYQ
jgi:hypothetical protein